MAFYNRIRLPFKLTRPQFPEEREAIRKANGETVTLSVTVRKVYEGETDYWPERWHERFKIALAHDKVTVEGEKYVGYVAQDGEYTIEWPEFLDYPTGKAAFKAEVTPFNNTNANCQTCEEAAQVDLENDTVTGIYGALQPGMEYEWPLADNDTICCYPAVFSLTSFNTDYIASASIDAETGVLTFTTKEEYTDANGVVIATYRVTCPNGGYDEAKLNADFSGSEEGCLAPTNLVNDGTTPTSLSFTWDPPTAGTLTYDWEIYEGDSPVGSPVDSGQSVTDDPGISLVITNLDPNTDYYFQVRTNCGDENTSNFIGIEASTELETDSCGLYLVSFNDGSGNPANFRNVSYRDCSGNLQAAVVFNMSSIYVCAFQSAPGVPVFISGSGGVSITYDSLC